MSMQLQSFCFNDFQENTYVLYDETGECVIVDPGAYRPNEKAELLSFVENEKLKPKLLLNTHGHIDHILADDFVRNAYHIPLLIHRLEQQVLDRSMEVGSMYGVFLEAVPVPDRWIEAGEVLRFGNSELEVLFTPGHSPGSVSFYNKKEGVLISGDVLFRMSIGRFDFPGGNYETLMHSITQTLLPLPGNTRVYSGHGPVTTLAYEQHNNPYILEYAENGAS